MADKDDLMIMLNPEKSFELNLHDKFEFRAADFPEAKGRRVRRGGPPLQPVLLHGRAADDDAPARHSHAHRAGWILRAIFGAGLESKCQAKPLPVMLDFLYLGLN